MNQRFVIPAVVILLAIAVFLRMNAGSSPQAAPGSSEIAQATTGGSNPAPTEIADGDGPRAYFPATSYDFGNLAQGVDATHKFVVQNKGNQPLKLIKAKAG